MVGRACLEDARISSGGADPNEACLERRTWEGGKKVRYQGRCPLY